MDPRAERAVHDQMVEITCRPEAGQYFLITPKLLSGLRYHKLMKVLLINNGDWLPEKLKCTSFPLMQYPILSRANALGATPVQPLSLHPEHRLMYYIIIR